MNFMYNYIFYSKVNSGDYIIGNQFYSIKKSNNNVSISNKYITSVIAIKKCIGNNNLFYEPIKSKEFLEDMSSFINNVKIVYCENGKCIPTFGYLKYKDDKEEKLIKCDQKKCDTNSDLKDCSTDIFYFQSEIKICVKDNNSDNYEINSLKKSSTYFIPLSNDIYNIYISDSNGNYIALISQGKLCFHVFYIYLYIFILFYFIFFLKKYKIFYYLIFNIITMN